ncbi:MAG: KH domain-containing protein [Clostridia bacterium]|nr:KH domain-containing protein [Clostridia bacterium]
MKEVLEIIARSLVEYPDQVDVKSIENEDGTVTLELRVAESDMGKVIGKQGRIAKALRTVVKAAASRENKKVAVEILQ